MLVFIENERTPKISTCMRKMFVQFFKHFKMYFQMSAAYAVGSKVLVQDGESKPPKRQLGTASYCSRFDRLGFDAYDQGGWLVLALYWHMHLLKIIPPWI
jgi:hypothetical protein